MNDRETFGPEDKNLWLNRPLGHWEKKYLLPSTSLQVPMGPGRMTINSVYELDTNPGFEFNVDVFEKAVRATIYKQPHLRCRADLRSSPMMWRPAEDFEGVFSFVNPGRLDGCGPEGENGSSCDHPDRVADVWDLVEEAANRPWNYDSLKPLYRCTLIKLKRGYVVMHTFHHSAMDSRSGMHAMSDVLEFYAAFEKGDESKPNPLPLRGSMDELSFLSGEESILDEMRRFNVERSKAPNDLVPYDITEAAANNSLKLPVAKMLFHEGDATKLEEMRRRCRKEKVTIGSLIVAAQNFSVCLLRALQDGKEFEGIKNHYTGIPVDMRPRLDPPLGSLCGFYAIDFFIKTDVSLTTNLWDHARDVKNQMDRAFQEKHHMLRIQSLKDWELGPTASLAAAADTSHPICVASNVGVFPGRKQFPWGKIRSVYTTGFMEHFLLLIQSTDRMTYNVISGPGNNNESSARKSLKVIVDLMENAGDEQRKVDLFSVLRKHGVDL